MSFVLEAGATYYGLSDIVEVVAWVEDGSGNEIQKQLRTMTVQLMHANVEMSRVVIEPWHYYKEQDEEKGSFRAFFIHPPIQNHQYVQVTAELKNDEKSRLRIPVMTEKMLRKKDQLVNPSFGGHKALVYPLPIEEQEK